MLHSQMVPPKGITWLFLCPDITISYQSQAGKGMKIMPYIPPSVMQEVKRMDLLAYLKNYEPYELVHFSGNTYTTRTHDSLKISNGKWMWWSRGIGGRSALDYLIKVKEYSFLEAVELLAGQANIQPPLSVSEQLPVEKHLLLPKENRYHTNMFSYLTGRGIDNDIGVIVSEAVISTDMVSRHIKRQEKKCDSLMVNLEYTIPENRLDF